MGPKPERRTTTLSISLPPRLADEVAARVDTGLYASASELVREALRLLLRSENETTAGADRLEVALGMQSAVCEAPAVPGGITEEELEQRLAQLSLEQELFDGVRRAPDRTERIRRGPAASE